MLACFFTPRDVRSRARALPKRSEFEEPLQKKKMCSEQKKKKRRRGSFVFFFLIFFFSKGTIVRRKADRNGSNRTSCRRCATKLSLLRAKRRKVTNQKRRKDGMESFRSFPFFCVSRCFVAFVSRKEWIRFVFSRAEDVFEWTEMKRNASMIRTVGSRLTLTSNRTFRILDVWNLACDFGVRSVEHVLDVCFSPGSTFPATTFVCRWQFLF